MNPLERFNLLLKAKTDPLFFLTDKFFLNEKPFPNQAAIFSEFFAGGYKELDAVGGMGSGKTHLASYFGCYDTFDLLTRPDPAKDYGLASHSPISILCVAKSDEQSADTIFAAIKAKLRISPFFQEYRPVIREYNIIFREHPDIELIAGGAASAGSLPGRNLKCVIFDEIDSYDETQSQRGAWQVYSRLSKSTNRFGFHGHIIAISSPWHINSIIMQLTRRKAPKVLTKSFTTWEMNPNKSLDSPEMQDELTKDPITFWRDYGIEPQSSIESYYPDTDVIKMNSARKNILESVPKSLKDCNPNETFLLSIDPATVTNSFGIAILHKENEKVIADGLWKFEPQDRRQLNPIEIKHFVTAIVSTLRIRYLVTDMWSYQELMADLQRLGITILFKPLRKEEHDDVRNAWFENKLEICHYLPIINEFQQLIRLDSKRIGVVRGGNIDVVDALTRGYWAMKQHLVSSPSPNVVEVI